MDEVKIVAPHSLVLLHDAENWPPAPQSFSGALVAATSRCVAIGTLCELDGETTIRRMDGAVEDLGEPVFAGVLPNPSGRLAVTLVDGRTVLELMTASPSALVSIWANDPVEPGLHQARPRMR